VLLLIAMDRPLIIGAVSYLIGLVLGAAFTYFPLTVLLVAVAGMGVSIQLARIRYVPRGRLLWGGIMLLGGFVTLQMSVSSRTADDLSHLVEQDRAVIRGSIVAPPRHRTDVVEEVGTTVLLMGAKTAMINGIEHPSRGRIRVTVRGFDPEVEYGDEIMVRGRLRPPTGFRNPGGFDYAEYLSRQGIQAVATVRRPENLTRLHTGGSAVLRKIYAWRDEIREASIQSLSPEASAILQAMVIGETGSLTPEIREAFMASGTTHLLSISGSHLSLVATAVFAASLWLIRHLPAGLLLRMGRRLKPTQAAALWTIPPVVFYALLAGGQVATIRSLIMILVYLAAVGLVRDHDPLHALAAAFLLVTIPDPVAIFDISFQLSYGAVLAMVLIIKREGSKMKTAILLSVAAGISTAPLVAFHFNQLSWVGLVSNLIVVPFVGFVIVPIGLIGALWVIGTGSPGFPWVGGINGLIGLLMIMVRTFSHFPWAELHVPSPPVGVLALWYAAAGIVLLKSNRVLRMGLPLFCLCLTLPWIIGIARADERLRLAFLDVGQGDAALIEFPDGKTMLIDGGRRYGDFDVGRLAVAPYLWDRSVKNIDYMAVTHPQTDHVGGLISILQKFHVGAILTNGAKEGSDLFFDLIRLSKQNGVPVRAVHAGIPSLSIGGASVSILHPGDDSGSGDNNRSLVIRIEYGRHSFLFTGDIEAPAERELAKKGDLLSSSVLKVPHHGSRTSIEPGFLLRACPRSAVISSGATNPYGHPAPETLAAYGLMNTRLYRTDREGAVIMSTDGRDLIISTYSDWKLAEVRLNREIAREEWNNWKKTARRWIGADPA
jgi:competence protein ComEC